MMSQITATMIKSQTKKTQKYKNTTKNTETTQPIIKWMMSQITATTTNSQTIPVEANHCTAWLQRPLPLKNAETCKHTQKKT